MNQPERIRYLVKELLKENAKYKESKIQNGYLLEELKNKGIIQLEDLGELQKDIYLWQGDIKRLNVSVIVNIKNKQDKEEILESYYRSSLEIAKEYNLTSIAFVSVSTEILNKRSVEIAIKTVQKFKEETNSQIKVVFNVHKNEEAEIYWRLLCEK